MTYRKLVWQSGGVPYTLQVQRISALPEEASLLYLQQSLCLLLCHIACMSSSVLG